MVSGASKGTTPTISVIIPAYREANRISHLVKAVCQENGVTEIFVVDGGSDDGTPEIATKAGAKVLLSGQLGRAYQMNYGAAQAKGDILHFIHADAQPPKGFTTDIQEAYLKGYPAGCFRSCFQTRNVFLLANSYFTRFKGLMFRGGGQTLFIDRELFEELGGYRDELRLMEEYDLISRIKRHEPFHVIQRDVMVSPRKYEEKGAFKVQLFYAILMLLFFMGFPQDRLIKLYKRLIH